MSSAGIADVGVWKACLTLPIPTIELPYNRWEQWFATVTYMR
jgi:hypothetical protein